MLFNAVAGDGSITVSLTDVRCRGTSGGCSTGPLRDYSGHLLFATNFRITDKNSGPSGVGLSANATVNDLQLDFPVPCATTASTSIGSTCSVTTSIDSVLGGSTAIVDGKRAIWQLIAFTSGRVIEVDDGGADGVATTFDNTAFAAGGLFFP